tara:strand:+ start:349 stop:660 length:312 start_codon:yes stop_codon:yes gene_type:complete
MSDDKTREVLARLTHAIDEILAGSLSNVGMSRNWDILTARRHEARLHLEALALVPDNRVDGNGIHLADLEAVDDELANKVEEGMKVLREEFAIGDELDKEDRQ